MKLNYRDRIVLTVLIVLLVWALGIMLFIKPGIENLNSAQAALDDAKVTRSDLQKRVDDDKDLPERIQTAYKEVTKMTESFYDIQETQAASQMVDDLLDSDEITNLNMNISDYQSYILNPYAYKSDRVNVPIDDEVNNYTSENPVSEDDVITTPTDGQNQDIISYDAEGNVVAIPATIGCYTISFDFEGKIEDVEKFCEKLQTSNDQKTMVVQNISYQFAEIVTEDKDGNKTPVANGTDPNKKELSDTDVEGKMELTMMVVRKLPDPDTLA